MAQKPKQARRLAILDAAAQEFAEVGFQGATLANVVARAGTSIGNFYKYFASKEALFEAVVPNALALRLSELMQQRVRSLGDVRDVDSLSPEHSYSVASEALRGFAVAHRPQVLFLLSRGQGTAYATFTDDLVASLTDLAVEYAERAYPSAELTPSLRRALSRIYRTFIVSLALILREEPGETELSEATRHFTTYHLAGLRACFVAAEAESTRNRGA